MKKTYDFDFSAGEFAKEGKNLRALSGADALKKWMEKALKTQADQYRLYKGTGYGFRGGDLMVGRLFSSDFLLSELRRECEKTLLMHEDITEIREFRVEKNGARLTIGFTAVTPYGEVEGGGRYDG